MKSYKKRVKELLAQEANTSCFDCELPNPQWASVTFGTFICLECAGTHRSYGASISRVKSINMDEWSEKEYHKMKIGGNEEFGKFVSSHNLNKKEDMFYKKSIVASYAKKLESTVGGASKENEKPGLSEDARGKHTKSGVAPQTKSYSYAEKKKPSESFSRAGRRVSSSSESSLHQALNTTISVVGKSVATGARLIKNKTVEYSGKISENIVKPSIKMLKEKKSSFSKSSKSESDIIEVRPKNNVKEDTTWCQWD